MKSNKEMRAEAWRILCKTNWTWRVIVTGAVLIALMFAITAGLEHFYQSHGIQTWAMFRESARHAKEMGLGFSPTSARHMWQMTGASAFQTFIENIFGGIAAIGLMALVLRAVRGEEKGWFGSAFAGFRYPFGVFWLSTLMALYIGLWLLLLIVPGIIAALRYSLAWYLKAEKPELGADACLRMSSELMDGYKKRLLLFAFSYIGWWAGAVALAGAAVVSAALAPALGSLLAAVAIMYVVYLMVYVSFGKAVFYSELLKDRALRMSAAEAPGPSETIENKENDNEKPAES